MNSFKILTLLIILLSCAIISNIAIADNGDSKVIIAVLDFDNSTGNKENDRFISGISGSINSFISNAEGISIVERKRLDSALEEIVLANTGLINEDEALEIGKFLQANLIIVGSFLFENNVYRITCRALEVETSLIRFADQSEDSDIYQAMDDLSIKILNHLGYDVREVHKSILQRIGPWTSLVLTAGTSSGAFLMNNEGNDAYDKYQRTVDPQKMDSYYNDAESFDSKRNIMIGLSCTAAVLTVYLFKTQTGKEWNIRKIGNEKGQSKFLPWITPSFDGAILLGIKWEVERGIIR